MDYLREGVTLRGYGQRDPLIEYQREGYDMFTAMMEGIKEESVTSLFNLQVQVQQDPIIADAAATGAVAGQGAPGLTAAPPAPQAPPTRASAATAARPARSQQARPQPQGRPVRPPAGATADEGQEEAPLPAGLARGLARPARSGQLSYSAPSEDGSGTAQHVTTATEEGDYANVGRNAPCPCGSGRKFKQCHGDPRNRE
jgi:preprotein translocase subunit SecA